MIIGIVAMILGLMLIVTVHEFGHWIVARLCGMWTPVFSIGFGPRKYSIVLGKFWDTEFRLSPIPLGGYVALPEMGDETSSDEIARQLGSEPRTFRKFPIWQRMCVAVAGVVMNVVLAIVLLFGLFAIKGEPFYAVTGTFVSETSSQVTIARDAGLQAKDVILSVDGKQVVAPDTLVTELGSHKGQPVVLHVRRGTAETDVTVVPNNDGRIGIAIGVFQELQFKPVSIGEAASGSVHKSFSALGQITYAIAGMVHLVPATPGADASGVHGIVGIVQFGADAWAAGLVQFVMVLVMISLNLAVMNILPVPMLDGGYVLFFTIEKLRGKPLAVETQNKLKGIFLWALLGLFLFGLMNDFLHPIGK